MLNGWGNTMLFKKRKYTISDFIECRLLLEEHLGNAHYVKYSIGKFHLDEGKTVFAEREIFMEYAYTVTIISSISEEKFNHYLINGDITYDEVFTFTSNNRDNVLIVTSVASMRGYAPFTVDNLQPKDHFTYREVKHLFNS